MLTDEIESATEKVDILTDFDEVMINGHSKYKQIFARLLCLSVTDNIKFIEKVKENHIKYMETGDVRFFYELFEGCPVEELDKVANRLRKNKRWHRLFNGKKVGIVSRNNRRIISKYLSLNSIDVDIVAANEPEIIGEVYTGKVELVVNNNNLIDFVERKDYICGDEEREILDGFGIGSINLDKGIYLCSKKYL